MYTPDKIQPRQRARIQEGKKSNILFSYQLVPHTKHRGTNTRKWLYNASINSSNDVGHLHKLHVRL